MEYWSAGVLDEEGPAFMGESLLTIELLGVAGVQEWQNR
jgi:hypothetical protein